MADPPTLLQDSSVKKRAIRRLVVALILIGAAVVGLTLVDKLTVVDRPKPRPLPSIAVAPPPATPQQPTPPTELNDGGVPQASAPADADKPPVPEVSQVPDAHKEGSAPAAPTPPPATAPAAKDAMGRTPQTSAQPSPQAGASTPPAPPRAAAGTPAPSGPAGQRTGAAPPAATAGGPAAPPPTPGAAAPRTAAPMLKLEEAPVAPDKGYTVQMGVFNTYANADTLLAKLKERGIPAYTETRVLVGPFRSRAEARKAAQELKDMGAGRVLTPAAR